MTQFHVPVLAGEVERLLPLAPGRIVVDGTAGGGGHSERILKKILPGGFLIAIDRDEEAVRAATERLQEHKASAHVFHDDFTHVARIAGRLGFKRVDGILVDLGVSSHQLDTPERGFSFQRPGPLDMRFSRTQRDTAADIVNFAAQDELAELLRSWGEERFAGRIARSIVESRPIRTTEELSLAVERVVPRRFRERGKHPATRTFQALRIVVNEEIERLETFLAEAPGVLGPGGVLCVISYHSLEDRLVKVAFRELERGGGFQRLTKKPITPGAEEVAANPRARSAKLRALVRVNLEGSDPDL
jgi:16S rRNA (cytosine1402-N4)-methyltransferase